MVLGGTSQIRLKRNVARLLAKARVKPGWRLGSDKRIDRSYELYRERGENFRSVCVRVTGDDFVMDTHDMGPATKEFWGDSDYEFWRVVSKAEWPKLIAAFAKEAGADPWAVDPNTWSALTGARQARLLLAISKLLFEGEPRATDRLSEICDKYGVENRGGSWV